MPSPFDHIVCRKFVAIGVFGMAFMLTPRALVESGSSHDVEQIPVTMLDQSNDCAWCAPLEPVDCDALHTPGQPSEQPQPFWLNPDEPPRPQVLCTPAPDSTPAEHDLTGPNA